MEKLLPLKEADLGPNKGLSVDARALHAALAVGRDFSTWIKDRIFQYAFTENFDYRVFPKSGENPSGGRPALEYALSLDMAKELCMVENNEAGRVARKYFIEAENRFRLLAQSPPPAENPQNEDAIIFRGYEILAARVSRLKALAEAQAGHIAAQSDKIKADAPKVVFYENYAAAEGDVQIGEMAVMLTKAGFPIGRNGLFAELRILGWLVKAGGRKNLPTQRGAYSGYFVEASNLAKNYRGDYVYTKNGDKIIQRITMVTPKGQQFLMKKYVPNKKPTLFDFSPPPATMIAN
jgi:phage anti-repressor protein/phage antirepressor YoqD-like protein